VGGFTEWPRTSDPVCVTLYHVLENAMPATTDHIRFWIDASLECVRRDHTPSFSRGDQRGPFLSARALGMAVGALHDAPQPATNRLLDLPPSTPDGPPSSPGCASAAACHQLLLMRYPTQAHALNEAWDQWLELHPTLRDQPSELQGRQVGTAIHLLGIGDRGLAAKLDYTPSGPYAHDVPPDDPGQGFAGSSWGAAERLMTEAVPGFPKPPGRISGTVVHPDAHFAADFQKVQSKGAAQRRSRLASEEVTGIFWGYDGPPELGTPPRLYLQIVLGVLDEVDARRPTGLTDDEELRVVAGAALAMAEAGIDAWKYKYSADHMMWRPVLGIAHGLESLAPAEAGWKPLGRPDTNGSGLSLTPNFPAYPSGHATFGASAFQVLRTFLVEKKLAEFDADGVDNVRFCARSDEYNGRNRDPRGDKPARPVLHQPYASLWQAIVDNSVSRVYLGVHWQFDGITSKGTDPDGNFGIPDAPSKLGRRGGVWLGCQIGNQVASRIGVSEETIKASIPG
jgi:hypothetical protein